jgi:hypothetical protein
MAKQPLDAANAFQLVADTFVHSTSGLLDLTRLCPYSEVHFESDNLANYLSYMDFSVWPPALLPLPSSLEDKAFVSCWRPFYQVGANNIWQKSAPRNPKDIWEDFFTYAQVRTLSPWQAAPMGEPNQLLSQLFGIAVVIDDVIFHVNETRGAKNKWQYALLKISQNSSETWYESRYPLSLYTIKNSDKLLIIEDNKRYAVTNQPIQNNVFIDLPNIAYENAENGFMCINAHELIYTSRFKRPHIGHSDGAEWILQLNRLNMATGECVVATIDDFGTLEKQTVFDRATNTKKNIKRSNFDGNLIVHQGHDDWWVMSYKSNNIGESDIALFYNCKTDETFKITQKDLPHQWPSIVYMQALGRYLADFSCRVSLLAPFDAIYAAKQKNIVLWQQ